MTLTQAPGALPLWPDPDGHPCLERVTRGPSSRPPSHVHIVPSLSLGGAERIVLDLAKAAGDEGVVVDVAVMRNGRHVHQAPPHANVRYHELGGLPWPERLARVAGLVSASGLPGYCHLTSLDEMRKLWAHGIETVPVAHNATAGWQQDPRAWDSPLVPFAVACGERVAEQMRQAGCPVPVVALRHLPPAPPRLGGGRREAVRAAFGAGAGTLLLGMTGRVVPQKAHARAVRVLHALVAAGEDARLAVLGAVEPGAGEEAHRAAVEEAVRLGVRERVMFVGAVKDAGHLVHAFDVHLNTSHFEGVSIATMEAVAAGVPVVTADAGGQREAVGPADEVLPQDAGPHDYVAAVRRVLSRTEPTPPARRAAFVGANATLWPWLAAFRGAAFRARPHGEDVMFITGNMDVGGAQRSLAVLAATLARRGRRVTVGVCGPFGVPDFLRDPQEAGAEFVDLTDGGRHPRGPAGRIGRALTLVLERKPRTVCFWNMDAVGKAGIAKALSGSSVKVAEASPGPALYRELEEARGELAFLTSDPASYLRSLDAFASKYDGGLPAPDLRAPRVAVVPNGVPPARPLPDGEGPTPPPGCDPGRAVLVVGRLNATKKIGLLPRVARGLAERVPGATITVVGGAHGPGSLPEGLPDNLRFLPPDTRGSAFAHRFACFLMLSTEQGCPNASLEAMAAGIPVVANDDGGTREQVVDGVTGRLLTAGDDDGLVREAVDALSALLLDPASARQMGARARAHAQETFSVDRMADGYVPVLLQP